MPRPMRCCARQLSTGRRARGRSPWSTSPWPMRSIRCRTAIRAMPTRARCSPVRQRKPRPRARRAPCSRRCCRLKRRARRGLRRHDARNQEAAKRRGRSARRRGGGDRRCANDNSAVPDTYRPITARRLGAERRRSRQTRAKPGLRAPGSVPPDAAALASAEYARDYNERRPGRAQQRATRKRGRQFWTSPTSWRPGTKCRGSLPTIGAGSRKRRLFALMTMANANSFIVDWDAKSINYWRP